MLNEPRSPNIFDAVHLTQPKRPTPQGQDPSQNSYYFSKKLQSITQFMDFLECNPDDHTELTELQLRWERSFFKEELKAALFLNYSLIKLHCQVTQELKIVKKDLANRTERKKISQQFEQKLEWHTQASENCQAHSNQTPSSKKRVVRDAFEAQRKILQAKHQRQSEDLKKMVRKVQDLLRVSKQENQYMRGELLEISEKNFSLLNDNREAEDCTRKALEENKELRLRLEQLEKKSYHETKLNHLNCSPINRSIEAFGHDDAEISFNHQFFNENIIENKLLKKQIEEIQFELDQLKSENARLQGNQNDQQHDQHMDVMQESCRLFLVELEKEYLDVKKQLQANMAQVGKYQQIIKQMQAQNTEYIVKQPEIDRIDAPQKVLCSICSILSKENETLRAEKNKAQAKYEALRQKFDKTLNLQLIQRQQWDHFLKDLKTE